MTRTLEHRVKFDHGLGIGTHLVRFTLGERSVLALVRIGPRGKAEYLKRPDAGDMYSMWQRMRGNQSVADGVVLVWAARSRPDLMAQFEGEPVATIPVH